MHLHYAAATGWATNYHKFTMYVQLSLAWLWNCHYKTSQNYVDLIGRVLLVLTCGIKAPVTAAHQIRRAVVGSGLAAPPSASASAIPAAVCTLLIRSRSNSRLIQPRQLQFIYSLSYDLPLKYVERLAVGLPAKHSSQLRQSPSVQPQLTITK